MSGMKEAYDAWWRDLTRRGDPQRRPDLVFEAFAAGWNASGVVAASVVRRLLDAPEQLERGENRANKSERHTARIHANAFAEQFEGRPVPHHGSGP